MSSTYTVPSPISFCTRFWAKRPTNNMVGAEVKKPPSVYRTVGKHPFLCQVTSAKGPHTSAQRASLIKPYQLIQWVRLGE